MTSTVYFIEFIFRMLWQWDLLQYIKHGIRELSLDTSLYGQLVVRSCHRISKPSELLPNHVDQPYISLIVLEAPNEGEQPGSYRIIDTNVGMTNKAGVLV
jgi:hypothetical protein